QRGHGVGANRPPEWTNRREKRRDRQRSSASGEHGEHGYERQDVAVEVRVRGEQGQRVRGAEREQDQIRALAAAQLDDDPGGGHEDERAERLPEPQCEGEGRRWVTLEAEPPVPRELLDAV